MNPGMNSATKKILIIFIALFLILIIRVTYISIFKSQTYLSYAGNPRTIFDISKKPRGAIISSDNQILAESRFSQNNNRFIRVYPLGDITAHLIGFDSFKYGKSGAEKYFNKYLDPSPTRQLIFRFFEKFLKKERFQSDVVLTIDSELQKKASQLLDSRKGAIIAMNPSNGEILAAYSYPSFNPNNVDKDWKKLSRMEDGPLLFRASQGLYPPGSIFKIITAASAFKQGVQLNKIWNGPSSINIYGGKVTNFKDQENGEMNIIKAFTKSSNTIFAQIGLDVGGNNFVETSESFGINKVAKTDFIINRSMIPQASEMDELELAWSSVGQGKILITPLQALLMASAIANNGEIMLPHIQKEIRQLDGLLISESKPVTWLRPLSTADANKIKQMMINTVEDGTGNKAKINGIKVAGKTGTAEIGKENISHSWFVGFAPANSPKIAVAAIVENGGLGGKVAAPIVKSLIEEYLRKDTRVGTAE